jgi:hypothetical protein
MSVITLEGKTATGEFSKMQMKILSGLDTRAKLRKHQESKIREHYSRVFKNENNSLAKQGINIRSSIGTLSKTRKKQGFKVAVKKMTLKAAAETIMSHPISATDPTPTD